MVLRSASRLGSASAQFAFVTLAAAVIFAPAPAAAQSCNFNISNLSFGNIDVTTNSTFTSTATFSASCTGTASATVRVCPNIDAGSGGTSTGSPRLMLSGGDQLNFNLYQDGGYTTVWGSNLWGFSGTFPSPTIDITLNGSGSGNANQTIFGQVWSGQRTLPAGSYASAFTGGQVTVAYDYATMGSCATIGSSHGTSAPFTASATNVTTCSVSASSVNFGSTGVLQSALDATGSIGVTCTNSAPYTVALDGGTTGAADPVQRKMSKASEQITYGLYQNLALTQAWGDSVGSNTASGTGSGLLQTLTVYGRVPAQATPSPGTYSDTVVVTLSY